MKVDSVIEKKDAISFNSERTTVEVACACVLCKLFEVTAYSTRLFQLKNSIISDWKFPQKLFGRAFGEKYISAPDNSYS